MCVYIHIYIYTYIYIYIWIYADPDPKPGGSASTRGLRDTAEIVPFGISNSTKSYPSVFHADASTSRPAIGFCEPANLDEAPKRIPPTSQSRAWSRDALLLWNLAPEAWRISIYGDHKPPPPPPRKPIKVYHTF